MSYKVLKHIVFLSCYDVPMYFRQCLYLLFSVNVSWGVMGVSRDSRIWVEGGGGALNRAAHRFWEAGVMS